MGSRCLEAEKDRGGKNQYTTRHNGGGKIKKAARRSKLIMVRANPEY